VLGSTRAPIGVYVGFDPTADSLHVGHLMGQLGLRRFQLAGHRPFPLAGGATGMVGDPGGRSEERNLLDRDTLRHNVECIKGQLERILDFDPGRTPPCWSTTPTGRPRWGARLPARRRQARHRQPDDGQGVGAVNRLEGERHLVHRVQLHAAAGERLPAPLRRSTASSCRWAAPTSGATSPPAST
jgi:hypothetical protein